MFSNAYQSGPHVDVFDSKVNKDKNEFYANLFKSTQGVKKQFDKQTKNFLLQLQGQNAKLILPKDDHKQLCLVQQYLILQVFLPQGFPWSVQLTLTDTSKTKRRINLTTAVSKTQIKYFHVKQPIDHRVKRNTWLNLAIDCYSFMAAWKGQTFRSLDQIVVGSYCKLRRIFTMREKLIQFSNDDEAFEEKHGGVFVPKNFQLNADVIQTTQVIEFQGVEEGVPAGKEVVGGSGVNLANSAVKTAKKQVQQQVLSIPAPKIDEKKTIPKVYRQPQPPVKKPSSDAKSKNSSEVSSRSSLSPTSSMKKSNLSRNQKSKHNHPIPQHKSDEECDDQKQGYIKRQLGRLEKKDKFQPIGRAKKVFLSDAQQIQPPSSPEPKLVKIKDYLDNKNLDPVASEQADQIEDQINKYEDEGFEDSLDEIDRQQIKQIEKGLKQIKVGQQKLHNLFPTAIITKKNNETVVAEVKGGEDVELVYDEMLECYYDPKTNQYYEIS